MLAPLAYRARQIRTPFAFAAMMKAVSVDSPSLFSNESELSDWIANAACCFVSRTGGLRFSQGLQPP